jgi:RNA methyltransferase, TrmH family
VTGAIDGFRSMNRRPKPPRATSREENEVVYGVRACLALAAARPDDVLRIGISASARGDASDLLRWAAGSDVPVDELPDRELEEIAGAKNHEGLCVLSRPRRWASADELVSAVEGGKGVAIALDRVRNPYNIGAILRSAAFFGFDAALIGAPAPHPALPPDAVRVAEGGAERILLSRTTDLGETLSRLKKRGLAVLGAEGRGNRSLFGFRFPRRSILVMGNEREGLGERIRAQCDELIAIPGSGAVESLNVAVAAGVLMAEMVRAPVRGLDASAPVEPGVCPSHVHG